MRKIILNITTTILITGGTIIAYQSHAGKYIMLKDTIPVSKEYVLNAGANLNQSVNEPLSLVKSDTLSLWQKFKTLSEEKIDDNDKRIIKLKTSTATGGEKMKAGYEKTISDLEYRNESLKKRLSDYKGDEKENLESFKQKFNDDIHALMKSIKSIRIK